MGLYEKKIKNDNEVSSPRSGLFLLGFKPPKGAFLISPQARVGPPGPGILGGPARIYISRHPQPPAKYIRFSEISKSLYARRVKINMLTDTGTWDIVGLCLIFIGGFMPKNKDEKFYRVRVVKESVYEIVVPLATKRDYKDATSVAMDYVCKYGETVLKLIHGPTISPKPFDGPAEVK